MVNLGGDCGLADATDAVIFLGQELPSGTPPAAVVATSGRRFAMYSPAELRLYQDRLAGLAACGSSAVRPTALHAGTHRIAGHQTASAAIVGLSVAAGELGSAGLSAGLFFFLPRRWLGLVGVPSFGMIYPRRCSCRAVVSGNSIESPFL